MKIDVNTISINYAKVGSGQPLLLLHGNGEDLSIFAPLTNLLKEHYTVYALDSRNHGQSTKTDDYSYQAMANDVIAFVEQLELKDVLVLGFSDGAIVAAMIEMQRPQTFSKMALLGINLKPSDFKEENIAYLKEEYAKTKDPLFKMMLEEPNIELESLKSIKCPTLVVRAEDELFEDSLYISIMNTIPQASLLIVSGHDHASYIVENDMMYKNLIKFFQ